MIVHLLRHGEVHNPDGVLYGRLPGFRLSTLGEQQAVLAAEWLQGRDIGQVISSPMERAQQTAAPLASALKLDVRIDERLIEASNRLEGHQVAGGKNLWRTNPWLFRNPVRPSWGEPYTIIAARMLAAVLGAADRSDGREAVCVSHQLPIVCVRRLVQGQRLFHDPRSRQCSLASLTTLHVDGERVLSVDYAEPAGATPKDAVPGA